MIALRERVDTFIRDEIIPYERDLRQEYHGPSEALRLELVARGRAAGLVSPQAPPENGGLGLDHRAMAVIFEAAGYSPLGPLAL
ncbi:acyl-CoA dehydrogenase, partial [Enterococcus hirae]